MLTLLTSYCIGWRVVRPIGVMTKFTQKMKEGTCLADKVKTVKELSSHPMFININKQYSEMHAAKKLLKKRHESMREEGSISRKKSLTEFRLS